VYCDRRITRCSLCKQFFQKQGTTYADVAARAVGKPKGQATGKAAVAKAQAQAQPQEDPTLAESTEEQDFASIPRLVEAIAKLSPPGGAKPQKGDEVVLEVLQARLQTLRAAKAAQQPLSLRFKVLEQRLQKATRASEVASEKALAKASEIEKLKLELAELLLGEATAKSKVEALQAEVSNARKDVEASPLMAVTNLGLQLEIPECLRSSADDKVKEMVEKAETAAAAAQAVFAELAKLAQAAQVKAPDPELDKPTEGDECMEQQEQQDSKRQRTDEDLSHELEAFDLEDWIAKTGLDEVAAGQARANPPRKNRSSPYCR